MNIILGFKYKGAKEQYLKDENGLGVKSRVAEFERISGLESESTELGAGIRVVFIIVISL